MKILWLDDEPGRLRPWIRALMDTGSEVDQVSDDREAFARLAGNAPYDLIIEDMMRPSHGAYGEEETQFGSRTGLAFLARLRARGDRTPVIVMTNARDDRAAMEVQSKYGARYFRKREMTPRAFVEFLKMSCFDMVELLYEAPEAQPAAAALVEMRVEEVNRAILKRLAGNPAEVYEVAPRRFEELVAQVYSDRGWSVKLTPKTRDGGHDLLARPPASVLDLSNMLTLVECKRYRSDRPIRVGMVRELLGVRGLYSASNGVIVTTSFFTADARAIEAQRPFEISLRDYDAWRDWLAQYG